MANFLALWDEYYSASKKKFQSFQAADDEFLVTLDTQMQMELNKAEAAIKNAIGKVVSTDTGLNVAYAKEVNFEVCLLVFNRVIVFQSFVALQQNALRIERSGLNTTRTEAVVDIRQKIEEAKKSMEARFTFV